MKYNLMLIQAIMFNFMTNCMEQLSGERINQSMISSIGRCQILLFHPMISLLYHIE